MSRERVIERLQQQGKEIKIFPDAGDILNPSVMHRWQKVISLLEEWGCSVTISWWGQVDKSYPDIDELDDLSSICFITTKDFLSWAESEEKDKNASTKTSPEVLPQKTYIPNQPTSSNKSQKRGSLPSNVTNQKSVLLRQSTTFDILNPPLIASSLIQCLKDGISKVLPLLESVASSLMTEEKAPMQKNSFRRTALTQMSSAGIPLRHIQEISGHSDLGSLQRYLEVTPDQRKYAVSVIGF
ncbi:MAG TPA: tyrosine-type recombinase/integrase [Coleofasciculaceae cyanobacterium]